MAETEPAALARLPALSNINSSAAPIIWFAVILIEFAKYIPVGVKS
jgi:hypothetical protein